MVAGGQVTVEITIDRVEAGCVVGWGWDSSRPDLSLTVELWQGGNVVGVSRARRSRSDVRESGRGTGLYGFSLVIPLRTSRDDDKFSIRATGYDVVISKLDDGSELNSAISREITTGFASAVDPKIKLTDVGIEFDVRPVHDGVEFHIAIDGREAPTHRVAGGDGNRDRLVASIPRSLADGGFHQVALRAGDLVLMVESAFIPVYKPLIRGNFEGLVGEVLSGWCVDDADPQTPVMVEIYVDDRLYDIVAASDFRADLIKIKPDGIGGFSWPLPGALRDGRNHRIWAVPLLSDRPLPGQQTNAVFPLRASAPLYRFGTSALSVATLSGGYQLKNAEFADALAGFSGLTAWQNSMQPLLRAMSARPKVTVVVPVYNAAESVALCLQSLIRNTTYPCEILLIDDASQQAEVPPLLQKYARLPNVHVVSNQVNIGYTRNCNLAIGQTTGDLVFLNSDTYVPPRWLERLVVAANRRSDIATVTATSNHSGAFSVPEPYGVNPTPATMTPEGYATLLSRVSGLNQPVVPTGNGFCMYVRRAAVEEIGGFDEEAFPRGYGEENDFCLRALKAGWTNVIDDRSFVYHIRSASFGDEQPQLQEAAQAALAQRHPDYTALTQTFNNDPLVKDMRSRAQTLARWVNQPRTQVASNRLSLPRILYTLHYDGEGGTAMTTADLVGRVSEQFECFLIVPEKDTLKLDYWAGGAWRRVASVKLDGPMDLIDAPRPDYEAAVATLLLAYDISLLHVRHLIGHSFYLPRIAARLNIPVVMSYHDFYAVCPSVTLTDEKGTYCRGSCTAGFGECPTMVPLPPEQQPLKHGYIHTWHARIRASFPYCKTFVTTSDYVRDLFYRIYPELRDGDAFKVIEHGRDNSLQPSPAATPSEHEPFRVLLLGNILQPHKGFGVAQAVKALDKNNDVEFHFLGAAPPEAHKVGVAHGRYLRDELAERVAKVRPHAIAIFSIWPETYCHTLSEAWQLGVPVIGSVYGAVGERISRHGGGWAIDCNNAASVLDLIQRLRTDSAYWEAGRSSATAGNLRSVQAMASDYIEIYKQHLLPSQFSEAAVRRIFVIGNDRSAAWWAPTSLLLKVLRHPAVASHVNLVVTDIEGWRRDRFAVNSESLVFINDAALSAEDVQAAQSVAASFGAKMCMISDPAVHELFAYVDERDWPSLRENAVPAKLKVAGREMLQVGLLRGAVENGPRVEDLVSATQRDFVCNMTVFEADVPAHSADLDGAINGNDEAELARLLSAMFGRCALVLLYEPTTFWEQQLLPRIGMLGVPTLMVPAGASLEAVVENLTKRAESLLLPNAKSEKAIADKSIHRNAEAIVEAINALSSTPVARARRVRNKAASPAEADA
jgi:GT2 family glycosyltransferase/glycosyltransferase involved in cell wall biosynthesis